MSIKQEIVEYLKNSETPKTAHDIAVDLKCESREQIADVFDSLRELEEENIIFVTKKSKFATPEQLGFMSGIFSGAGISGAGIVRGEGFEFFIPARYNGNALPGDTVLVEKVKDEPAGKRESARVVRVIKKYEGSYTGIIKRHGRHFEFTADSVRLSVKVQIPLKSAQGASNGDKVAVKINGGSMLRGVLNGYIVKNYGDADTVNANYNAVLDFHRIRSEFPQEVLKQAKDLYNTPGIEKEAEKRTDLRDKIIFTIDGADALDLDDAVSVERTEGGYKLGVHIADVSHYVTHGSPLDVEALNRGTSVYFADKVVPMLPKELSNGICSLSENKDRLTMSCVMNIDKQGNIKDYDIFKSVIRSAKKCTYDEINAIFGGYADNDVLRAYEKLVPTLEIMRELSGILYKKRIARGALDFETAESKIILDNKGKVLDIRKRERGESQRLIEDFMLCANESVASYAFYREAPFVYRIHEVPDTEKTAPFLKLVNVLGYRQHGKNQTLYSKALQDIISYFKDTPYYRMISSVALRSLMKAKYSPLCKGHYGLALKNYCHFTSPIRRYPDLVCHRILTHLISSEAPEKIEMEFGGFVQKASVSSSECEIRAMNAERDIEDLFKAEYMSRYIGSEFTGIISSAASYGFYVELDNTVEGLVRVSSITDDYYTFDEDRLCFTGERTKKRFSVGDTVRIKVLAADITSGNIDFAISEEE